MPLPLTATSVTLNVFDSTRRTFVNERLVESDVKISWNHDILRIPKTSEKASEKASKASIEHETLINNTRKQLTAGVS